MRPTVSRQAGWAGGQCEGAGEAGARTDATRAESRSTITLGASHAQELGGGLCFCRQNMLRFRQTFKCERNALFDQLDDLLIGVGDSQPALEVGGLCPPTAFLEVVDDMNTFHQILRVESSVRASASARPTSPTRVPRTRLGGTVALS